MNLLRTFIWIESTWFKDPEGLPVIMIIARDTETDELVKLGIKDVIPYFYALADEVESETQPIIQSCYGDPIQRVNVTTPDQVPYERSRFLKTFDADILFDMRWLIDHNISYAFDEDLNPVKYDNIYVPRTLFFDIEVRSPPSIIPDPRNPIYPVVIISTCDSWTGEVKVFSWGIPDVQLNDIVIQVKGEDVQIKDVEHIPHKSEHSMFKSWADYIALLDPDIVTAWYGLGFDNPYITGRTRLLKVYIHKQLSRILDQYASDKHWPGRIVIDMMEYFKDWSKPMGKFDSYKLKFIAKELLKFEYDNEGGNIDQLFKDQEWEKLLTYSMKDAWVLKALDDHTGLIKFYEGLRKVAGIKFQDTLGRTKLIETLLMRRGIKPMPTRIRHDKEKLKGALVLEPPVGVHTDVGVFDLAQLYPTLIIMYNISPDIDKMIPKVIIEMMAERDKLKQKRLAGKATEAEKTSETSLKYAVNAFYGYMNYMNAKLFKVECARKITKGGRDIARELHKVMEEMGYTPIYGDSVAPDSPIFVYRNNMVNIIPIQYAKVNDLTWTENKWKIIKQVIEKPIRKDIWRVVTHDGIVDCTDDHSLMQNGEIINPIDVEKIDVVEFPESSNVNDIDWLDSQVAWLLGMYLAEGSKIGSFVINNQDNDILELCCNIIEELCEIRPNINDYMKSSRCNRISIPCVLNDLFNRCYIGKSKIIPAEILNCDDEHILESFFRGFYHGDGQQNNPGYNDEWKRIDQRSGVLAVGLQYILDRLGYTTSVRSAGSNKMSWGLRIGRYRRSPIGVVKGKWKINLSYDTVFDLEVEDTHTFTIGKLLVHNTDSTFDKGITSPEIGLEIQIKLNEFLINWTTKQGIDEKFAPSIKFEKLYRHIIFKPKTVIKRKRRSKKEIKHEPAKKRYAGHLVWKDGFIVDKLDIVGLEIRRSDSAPFTKQLMEEFLELVLHQNDTEKAIELVKTSYNKVLNGEVPLQEIAIPGGVKVRSNNSARTRGMDIAERELGLNFDSSESPRLLYLLRPWDEISLTSDITEIPMKKVLRPDIENNDLIEIEVPVFEIDWKVMAEKTVEKKMSPFLIAIGSRWENTVGGQKTLFDY